MLRRVRQSLRQVLILMARRPHLLCGVIVLSVLVVLAVKFTCSRAKNVVAAARPPVRFFSPDAPVMDLYLGQLDQLERLRSMAEVSFIFFYAPWCAHSMAARQEVQQVAKQLARQVQFVAVNCWWSQGKCRRQHRFFQYPIIHLFYRRFGPIEYKGPVVASYVQSFLLKVITPLTYLPSRVHLKDFLSNHEPRVVGFFQFNSSPQPPGYITYLSSALQALKRDFRGLVRFGVVTSKDVAESISITKDQTVYLHRRLNSSLIFPTKERNFTSESICSWVFENHQSVLQWLQPPGTKSRLLEEELTKGPALLLFLPTNPLGSEPSPMMQQVADIAVRYHSCHHSFRGFPLRSDCCQSVLLPRSSTSVCEVCLSAYPPPLPTLPLRCSLSFPHRGENPFRTYLRQCCLHPLPSLMSSRTESSAGCSEFHSSYSSFGHYSACCKTIPPQSNASQTKEEPENPRTQSMATKLDSGGITGLKCHTNRTLRFYMLDVDLNWPLAEKLGASGSRSASLHKLTSAHVNGSWDRSFAAIVNLRDEVHYVLHHSPAASWTESLEAFIRNFSAPCSLLQRHLVGEKDKNGSKKEEEGRVGTPARKQQQQHYSTRLLVRELTSTSFLSTIMDLKKDVLLFYYTQWCGFCSVLNHVIIQLARLLQENTSITVARVNVARNDLPWEFMVDHVPSILLFPISRKHQSVKFPDNLPITLPNLLRFILQHSGSAHTSDGQSVRPPRSGAGAVLHQELLALRREVQTLHHAREHLSRQLAQLWRDNRRLKFDIRSKEEKLEEQRREKNQQLEEALKRLEELADTSESLLNENTLLRVLLRALRDRTEAEERSVEDRQDSQQESHLAS